MSNDAPIGMFDSGIGGLTIAKALLQRLPQESLCYVGDTAHMPYGDKSPERLKEYATRIAQRLLDHGCKAIVVACNSASSNALKEVRALAGPDVPVVDVVRPVVDWTAAKHPSGNLGLIGTRATVQSGMYRELLSAHGLTVTSRATPLLASAIEEGFHNGTISSAVVEAYFSDGWAARLDALLLACTHYPLVADDIRSLLPPTVEVLDAPQIVARAVEDALAGCGKLSASNAPSRRFEVTDWTQSFADGASHILGSDVSLVEAPWPETH